LGHRFLKCSCLTSRWQVGAVLVRRAVEGLTRRGHAQPSEAHVALLTKLASNPTDEAAVAADNGARYSHKLASQREAHRTHITREWASYGVAKAELNAAEQKEKMLREAMPQGAEPSLEFRDATRRLYEAKHKEALAALVLARTLGIEKGHADRNTSRVGH
jgi:hypothetical protein